MPRPDFSDYVVHFTKKGPPLGLGVAKKPVDELKEIAALSAYDRLQAILEAGVVRATNMPHTDRPCVCFTECVWGSLLDHAERYSCYGIGFHKRLLFEQGGGPVFYMRQDLYEAQREAGGFDDAVWPFVTPFVPTYAPDDHVEKYRAGRGPIDYSHEREWRVPGDFAFERAKDVSFVIVDTYLDEARLPRELKDAIGRENIILMDNYRKVNALWPWHHY
jgi:hypothetical protein